MDNNYYKTDTFYIGVWLLARGYVPTAEWDDAGKICTFVFEELTPEEAEKHIQEYHQDDVIQEFIQANKKLKDIMYANKEPVLYKN